MLQQCRRHAFEVDSTRVIRSAASAKFSSMIDAVLAVPALHPLQRLFECLKFWALW